MRDQKRPRIASPVPGPVLNVPVAAVGPLGKRVMDHGWGIKPIGGGREASPAGAGGPDRIPPPQATRSGPGGSTRVVKMAVPGSLKWLVGLLPPPATFDGALQYDI